MLQVERYREIKFFTNSYITMNLQRLKEKIELKIASIKVGLRYKAVYCGRQIEDLNMASKKDTAIYINLDLDTFQNNFKIVIEIYGRSVLSFNNRTKMRLFTHPDLIKSDTVKEKLIKAYKRQKVFLKAIIQDYSSSLL